MDEEFKPASLSRCGELIEKLADVNHKRGEHPADSEDGPLGVVMVRVQIHQKCVDMSNDGNTELKNANLLI